MPQPIIKFQHNYDKLALSEFTTIRGAAQFKRLANVRRVTIETPRGSFEAEITGLELKRVSEMDVAFLDADTRYPGFRMTTRQDFVDLLNSFRAPAWQQVALDSLLTIIQLKKINP